MRYQHPELDIVRDALNATQTNDDPIMLWHILRHTTICAATKNSVSD
jgi:hypothetical protein